MMKLRLTYQDLVLFYPSPVPAIDQDLEILDEDTLEEYT
jgi:hypothetical protein